MGEYDDIDLPAVDAPDEEIEVDPGDSIQRAIDLLDDRHGGGTVHLNEGTHQVDSTIVVPNAGFNIEGENWSTTVVQATAALAPVIDFSVGQEWPGRLSNFYLDGNGQTAQDGVWAKNASTVMEDVVIRNVSRDGLVLDDWTDTLRHVEVWGSGRYNYNVLGGDNGTTMFGCRSVGGDTGVHHTGPQVSAFRWYGGSIEAATTTGYHAVTGGTESAYLNQPVLNGVHFEGNGTDVTLGEHYSGDFDNYLNGPVLRDCLLKSDTAIHCKTDKGVRGLTVDGVKFDAGSTTHLRLDYSNVTGVIREPWAFDYSKVAGGFGLSGLAVQDRHGNVQRLPMQSAAPTGHFAGQYYLDDGTNTGDGTPGWRVYDGAGWVDA